MDQQTIKHEANQAPFLLLPSLARVFPLNTFCQWLNSCASELHHTITHVDVLSYIGVLATLNQRVEVKQFALGQSNPTFLVTVYPDITMPNCCAKGSSPVLRMVLRQKPLKLIHESAHALHREFSVLLSLSYYCPSLIWIIVL